MNTMSGFTNRQREILQFIEKGVQRDHRVPSTRDIAREFGISQSAAVKHLRALEKKGAIQRIPAELVATTPSSHFVQVPVYGTIAAGRAAIAEQQEPQELIPVDLTAFGIAQNAEVFALRVRGDSMMNAHIVAGDTVILERRVPRPAEVVAALIDGESTLKTYVVKEGRPFLKAENPDYPDLVPARELVIQGVMAGLVRKGGRR